MSKTVCIVYHDFDFSEKDLYSLIKFVDPAVKEKEVRVTTINIAEHDENQTFADDDDVFYIVVLGPGFTSQYKTRESVVRVTAKNCKLVPIFWLPYDSDETNFHDVCGLGSYVNPLNSLSKNEIYKQYVRLVESIKRFIK